jgi:peptidoglycan/LPS O-acetylase OafA/YrhL
MLFPAAFLGVLGLVGLGLGPHGGLPFARTWTGVYRTSFFTHAHLFAPGLALAVARVEYQDGRLRLPDWWRPAAAIAAIAIVVGAIKLTVDGTVPQRWEPTLIAIACGLLLALVVMPRPASRSHLVRSLDSPALIGAGLVSYSVYLWHYPVILWLRDHDLTVGGGFGAFALDLAIVGTVVGVLSWLTYNLVERQALRFKAHTHVAAGKPAGGGPPRSEPASVAAGTSREP